VIKKNLTKLSPSLRYYYKNYESRKEKNRIRREVFRNSLEGKSKIKEYSQSTKGREVSRKATRKYQKTKKGSEKLLNYNRSQRGKEVRKKYYESKKSKKWWHEHRKKIDYKLLDEVCQKTGLNKLITDLKQGKQYAIWITA